MLLDFLRHFEAPCPVCNYNLHALTQPICPECGHELALSVGVWGGRLRMDWLLVALAPGFFSGIAAFFVLVMIFARLIFGDGRMSLGLNVVDLFGWCSGIFALLLAFGGRGRWRMRFVAQPRAAQRWWAIIIWLIHITAFALLLLGIRYF